MFEEAEKFAITFELDLEVSLKNATIHFIRIYSIQLPVLPFLFQLVYKVKLDFVLEQLASASVGGYGQDVWSELVEEAKTNLMKITVGYLVRSHFTVPKCS